MDPDKLWQQATSKKPKRGNLGVVEGVDTHPGSPRDPVTPERRFASDSVVLPDVMVWVSLLDRGVAA